MDREIAATLGYIEVTQKRVKQLQVWATHADCGPMARGWIYATRIVLDSAVMAIEKASQFADEYEQRKTK